MTKPPLLLEQFHHLTPTLAARGFITMQSTTVLPHPHLCLPLSVLGTQVTALYSSFSSNYLVLVNVVVNKSR